MKSNLKIFYILMIAYAISMAYQYYRSQVHQYAVYDTFATTEIAGYAILFGWSSLSLIQRKWALWSIVALCSFQLGLGFIYYIPVIFSIRHDTFWDWAELIVFVYLIALAGYSALAQLSHVKRESRLEKA
jgi:drug/metabolite transporter (DMT)-like permease